MATRPAKVTKEECVARARLRHQLRLFERFTEDACLAAGVTMPQYLLMLQIAGRPDREWALVGELAECLVLKHHTAVELAGRCEAAGFVRRERDEEDQRKVRVSLTPAGRRALDKIVRSLDREVERLDAHMRSASGAAGRPRQAA